jgi:aspartyl/asparaginyl beta-hydroxylase (cupin superfamily)
MNASAAPSLGLAEKAALHGMARLNRVFHWAAGGRSRPAYYDIDKTYPALRVLDENFSVIRDEMEAVLHDKDRIPRYHEIQKREQYISGTVSPEKAWRVFEIVTPFGTPTANQAKCPHTTALLRRIPGTFHGFFSILDPGKPIPAHSGEYYGYLRYHLGLRIPKVNPPSMRVKNEIHTWEEGKSILFDDSCEHEVYNEADGIRVVLIVDVMRPMPAPIHALNVFATRYVMRRLTEAKQIMAAIQERS